MRAIAQTIDPMVGFAGGGATTTGSGVGAGFGGSGGAVSFSGSGRAGAAGGGISAAVFFCSQAVNITAAPNRARIIFVISRKELEQTRVNFADWHAGRVSTYLLSPIDAASKNEAASTG